MADGGQVQLQPGKGGSGGWRRKSKVDAPPGRFGSAPNVNRWRSQTRAACANANDYSPAPESRSPSFTAIARDDTRSFASAPRSCSHPPAGASVSTRHMCSSLRAAASSTTGGTAAPGVRLGCSSAHSSMNRRPQANTSCPLAGEGWLCTWPEEGSPRLSASLRSGDSLPRPTNITDVQVKGQVQSDEWEQAGSSK